MNSSPVNPAIERFLATLGKLPPYTGIVFHGLHRPVNPSGTFTLNGLLATSADPLIATENFSCPSIMAVVSRSGRPLGPLAAHRAEKEVVLLPGTVLLGIGTLQIEGLPQEVLIFEELDTSAPADGTLPPTREALDAAITGYLSSALNADHVAITSPGKFVSDIPALS